MGSFSPSSSGASVSKRLRTEVPTANDDENCKTPPQPQPRFLIMHATGDQQLAKVSPFLLQKLISSLAGEPKSMQKLRSGDLLIETVGPSQSQSLLNTTAIGGLSITVTPHSTLNSSRGVISEFDLLSVSEPEILEGLCDQGVTAVRRITMRKDGAQIPTKHLILTFNTPRLPQSIKAGYLNCAVRPYIPNPMRCFQCQKYGHSKTSCRGSATCARCGVAGHDSEGCTAAPCCTNCKGAHPAYVRSCPKWLEEKEVQRVKITNNISFAEARRLVAPLQPRSHPSYAAAVKSTLTVAVQTEYSVPPKDSFAPLAKYLLSSQTAVTSEQSTSTAISVTTSPAKLISKQVQKHRKPLTNNRSIGDTTANKLKPNVKSNANIAKKIERKKSTAHSVGELSCNSADEVKKQPEKLEKTGCTFLPMEESSDSSEEEVQMEVEVNPRPSFTKNKKPIKLKRDGPASKPAAT